MPQKLAKPFVTATIGLLASFAASAMQEVEELADLSLPDIAAVSFAPGKAPVIRYNPALCLQAGRDLCEFYRYHEYGHITLRHNEREDLSRKEKESEADRWAAENAPMRCVLAAYRYFAGGGGASPLHGGSQDRAARMRKRTGIPWAGFNFHPAQLQASRD